MQPLLAFPQQVQLRGSPEFLPTVALRPCRPCMMFAIVLRRVREVLDLDRACTNHNHMYAYAAFNFQCFFVVCVNKVNKMGRRGPKSSPQMRSHICKLQSVRWSYKRIHKQHPKIPYSTIGNTCRKEAERVNNDLKPRCRALRVITREERDSQFEAVLLIHKISYEALQAQ